MKQLLITLTFGIIFIFSTFCAIAQTQVKTSIPNEVHLLQNPFNPMNILIMPVNIEGVSAQTADLIMAFDGDICVGAAVIEDINEMLNLVATSTDDVNRGYKSGQAIRLEYHSAFNNTVYELVPVKILLGSMNYEELGTLYADFKAQALSINMNSNATNVKVYPNPVSQQLNIVLENDGILKGEALNLKLFNMSGSIVIKKDIPANQSVISLDLATLPPGEYTLLLVNSNFKFTQKVIKK